MLESRCLRVERFSHIIMMNNYCGTVNGHIVTRDLAHSVTMGDNKHEKSVTNKCTNVIMMHNHVIISALW